MLMIFNTLTRKKEEFKPLKDKKVGFYHCGPTVYWTQHIGNMRAMVLADLFARSLEYLGYDVKLVRNYTDVGHLTSDEDMGEDKMEKGVKREGLSPEQIAKKYIKIFEQDIKDLNVIDPWKKPRATRYIKEMIKMVEILLEKGYAYTTDLAIYYDVTKFENYTQLSRQDLEKIMNDAGKGEVSDSKKKNPVDFALWFFKAGTHKNALQTWTSPFKSSLVEKGEGFPGWHIECSAMSQKYLGDTLDLHMGGIEHVPVHHTNEIAQSEAATGKKFVNYWIHNEHLNVNDGKMSKSGGTAYTVEEIKQRGYDPLALRYLFLQAHYRSKQNFTWEALKSSEAALNNMRKRVIGISETGKGKVDTHFKERFIESIADDFNLPQALAVAWDMLKSDIYSADKYKTILDFDKIFGFNLASLKLNEIPGLPKEIEGLAVQRDEARKREDFQKADKIRKEIESKGYEVEDSEEGFVVKKK